MLHAGLTCHWCSCSSCSSWLHCLHWHIGRHALCSQVCWHGPHGRGVHLRRTAHSTQQPCRIDLNDILYMNTSAAAGSTACCCSPTWH